MPINRHGHAHSNNKTHKRNAVQNKIKSQQRFLTMRCSPAARKKSAGLHTTCFSPEVIELIRKEYNKDHPDDVINGGTPLAVWKQLNARLMGKCSTEDCWLDKIDDANLRKKIDAYFFAPDQPKEWEKKPNFWLSNIEIKKVMDQYEVAYPEFEFMGPTPIDYDAANKSNGNKCVDMQMCELDLAKEMAKGKRKFGVVFNLSKQGTYGSHWVALYADLVENLIFFFDSNGDKQNAQIEEFMRKIESQAAALGHKLKRVNNLGWRHQNEDTECGMYSMYFLITMLTGKPSGEEKEAMPFKKRMNMFLTQKISDKYVRMYRKIYFNSRESGTYGLSAVGH